MVVVAALFRYLEHVVRIYLLIKRQFATSTTKKNVTVLCFENQLCEQIYNIKIVCVLRLEVFDALACLVGFPINVGPTFYVRFCMYFVWCF